MENQVREISLRQLFWKVMMGWKLWIVCAVLFAILLPGVKYAKDVRAYHAALQPKDEKQEPTVVLTDDEQQQIDDVKSLKLLIEKNSNYMQNSIMMNIDPYQEHRMELQYYIDSDFVMNYTKDSKKDYTSAIANAYVDYANNGVDQKTIWKDVSAKSEDKYLAELVSAYSNSDNTFSVIIKYTDKKGLESVAKQIQNELEKKQPEFSKRIGGHKLVLVSENYQICTDSDLATSQGNVSNLIKSYRDQITTLKSAMSEDQLSELEREENLESDDKEESATVQDAAPALSKKYVVCIAVLSNKLQAAEELVRYYKMRQFGIITREQRTKGITGFLLRIKYRNQKMLSPEASLQMASSNIELYCKNEGITKLFLTGSEIERMKKEWITKLTEHLKASGIQVVYGENICYDSAAMREASEAGHVVLVEITDTSIYQEIEKELRMLKDWNVDVIGCVGVE